MVNSFPQVPWDSSGKLEAEVKTQIKKDLASTKYGEEKFECQSFQKPNAAIVVQKHRGAWEATQCPSLQALAEGRRLT